MRRSSAGGSDEVSLNFPRRRLRERLVSHHDIDDAPVSRLLLIIFVHFLPDLFSDDIRTHLFRLRLIRKNVGDQTLGLAHHYDFTDERYFIQIIFEFFRGFFALDGVKKG